MRVERRGDGATEELHHVWMAAFGPAWALPPDRFVEVLAEKELLVVRDAGSIVGFLAFEQAEGTAAIAVIAVTPAQQRQGIGTTLLREALTILDGADVSTVRAGAGCGAYFWPGTPAGLDPACRLFETAGFDRRAPCHDLSRLLQDFHAPAVPPEGARLGDGTGAEPALLAFQDAHFPVWTAAYRAALQADRQADVILVRDASGDILGSALLFAPGEYLWPEPLGGTVGGFGKVGVRADRRGRGLGSALAAKATETLRIRGHERALVDWTDRPDWYARLGYRIHRSYVMATRTRPPNPRLQAPVPNLPINGEIRVHAQS